MQAEVAGEKRTVVQQTLQWDELNPQQRLAIVNATVPDCFPADSRLALASKPWAEIHPRTQLALSTVPWDRVIQGICQ